MLRYILGRLLASMPVLLGISMVVFLVTNLIPGDVVDILMGATRSPQAEATLRELFGLNRPIYLRYFFWLGNLMRGDFGVSLRTGEPVLKALLEGLPPTVELASLSLLVGLLLGVPSGILAAVKHHSPADYATSVFSLVGICFPDFWLGTMLVLVFAVILPVFPPTGYIDFWADPVANLRLMVLPAFTLGLGSASVIMRMTRSTMLEVIAADYIRTARSKGLSERLVLLRHALKNALIPIVTVVGIEAGFLLSGVVVVETIFSIPGLGRLALNAVKMRDYPMLQGVVLLVAIIFVTVNLAVDILYAYFDPRIHYDS